MKKIQELEKTGKRAFAVERESFREGLTDYAVERRTLFTTGCPHYVNCWNMKRLIDGMDRATRIKVLTALAIAILQFRIEEDWVIYCHQETTKDDIRRAVPNFPTSYLEATLRDLQRGIVLVPATFPAEQLRLLRGASVPTKTEGRSIERGLGMLLPPAGSPPVFDGVLDVGSDTDDKVDPLRVKGWHDMALPEFKELTKNLRSKKVTLQLSEGLEKAGMKIDDLPKIKCRDTENRKGFCYKFALGNCSSGKACNFCHFAGSSLSDEVVDALRAPFTKLVREGFEKLEPKKGSRKRKRSGKKTT